MRHVGFIESLIRHILEWPGISSHPHRFGGTEFRYGRVEIGHIHDNGTLDIPYTRAIRDELHSRGLVEEHRWVPDSGWSTFHIRTEDDMPQAVWLMRLSYLRIGVRMAFRAGARGVVGVVLRGASSQVVQSNHILTQSATPAAVQYARRA